MGTVITLSDALMVAKEAQKKGEIVVATNGCFDLLHVGHIRNLADAKKLGDMLIVGVNSDASVRENKGHLRPIIPERERAEVIAALESVDYAFIFSAKTPMNWIQRLRPNIHVKGVDATAHPDFPAQKEIIEGYGGRFHLLPLSKGRSTSNIIRKILGK